MHRHALFSVLGLALVFVGCSAPSADAPEESTERPAGCNRNRCDVEYERCKPTERDPCAECNATCSTMDYELAVQCLDACMRICSRPSTSTCGSIRDSCAKTSRNAICTDGMAPDDLPTSPAWFYSFRSPMEAHRAACTADELKDFDEACLGAKSSTSSCQAFAEAHPDCRQCIVTDAVAPEWGPLLFDSSGHSWLNTEGCIAHVAGDESCAAKVYEANKCLSGCNGATDRDACIAFARAQDCKKVVTEAESCSAKLGVGTSPAYAPCGPAVGDATEEITRSIIEFFCGSP